MRATSTSMRAESPSARTPTVASGPASAGIHVQSHSDSPPLRVVSRSAPMAAARAPAAKSTDRPAAARPCRRSGATTARMTKAAAGRSRARRAGRAGSVMGFPSTFEDVQVVGHHRALHPEDEDDDSEAERHLGHRDGNGEGGEDHAHDVGIEAREGDEVDVDGVQHELDAEEDAHGIPPCHHAKEADGEEDGGQGEIGTEAHAICPRHNGQVDRLTAYSFLGPSEVERAEKPDEEEDSEELEGQDELRHQHLAEGPRHVHPDGQVLMTEFVLPFELLAVLLLVGLLGALYFARPEE